MAECPRCAELQRQLAEHEATSADIERELQAALDSLDEQHAAATKRASSAEAECLSLRQRLAVAQSDTTEAQEGLHAATEAGDTARAALRELREDAEKMERIARQDAFALRKAQEERDAAVEGRILAQEEAAELREETAALRADLRHARTELDEAQEEARRLQQAQQAQSQAQAKAEAERATKSSGRAHEVAADPRTPNGQVAGDHNHRDAREGSPAAADGAPQFVSAEEFTRLLEWMRAIARRGGPSPHDDPNL